MININIYHYYLGMKIICNQKTSIIILFQKFYFNNGLKKFGIANSFRIATLIKKHFSKNLVKYFSDLEFQNTYQAVIELLIYAMIKT